MCCRISLCLCSWYDSWGQAFMTQTLTNGLSHTRPVAVTDLMHLPCLIKCHKWPFLNYLKLLTSPNLFMQYLSPSLRGPWRCSFSTVRQNVPQILTRSWSSAFTECFQLWLFNKSTGNVVSINSVKKVIYKEEFLLWHSGLGIQCRLCSGEGSIPGPGTSICRGYSPKKENFIVFPMCLKVITQW